MKYIKFLFLSFVALIAMSCDKGPDLELTVQRFPEAAFYSGELTQQVGEEQSVYTTYVELNKLHSGGYSFSIAVDSEENGQYVLFKEVDGEMNSDMLTLVHENIVGKLNLTALYNNLGKGASGAAVQCINISQGLDQTLGLEL